MDLLRIDLDRLGAAFALEDHELVAQLNDAGQFARLELEGDVFELRLAAEAADRRHFAAERLCCSARPSIPRPGRRSSPSTCSGAPCPTLPGPCACSGSTIARQRTRSP